jgi:hypothetical protein
MTSPRGLVVQILKKIQKVILTFDITLQWLDNEYLNIKQYSRIM